MYALLAFEERRCEVLEILIIPENMQRGDRILNVICNIETEPIAEYSKGRKRIRTQGGTIYKVIRVVDSILCSSFVPTEFQIIDDRKILNGCIRPY